MRVYQTLREAALEIRRDIAKGEKVTSTRVQHWTDREIPGLERLGYLYAIVGRAPDAYPQGLNELIELGREMDFPAFRDVKSAKQWLEHETMSRLKGFGVLSVDPTERLHPALRKTLMEGGYPSYTYTERLSGSIKQLAHVLRLNPDSRRAFWPIFTQADSLRTHAPTRVPCSLGYQAIIRKVGGMDQLHLVYLERSADFDQFWLSDIWLARQFQVALADELLITPGPLMHFVISFHSFLVGDQEIY